MHTHDDMESLPYDLRRKILTRDAARDEFGPSRSFSLVFTNGCFDLLHRGHVELFIAAKTHGEQLIVGINSDDSVRRLKGPGRPLMPVVDRAACLAALSAVDGVVVFDEDTPHRLIGALQPDVLVKGGDYRTDQVVGREIVEARGGRVIIFPFLQGRSTTSMIERAAQVADEET